MTRVRPTTHWPHHLAAAASGIAGFIGLWFFLTEREYAAQHNSALAGTLQWVGVAIALLGIAGVLLAFSLKTQTTRQATDSSNVRHPGPEGEEP